MPGVPSLSVDELLFNSGYLRDAIAQQGNRMLEEVNRALEDHLLHVDVDAWSSALAERYRVEPPEPAPEGDWYQDEPKSIQVDVSHDRFMRAIIDPTTPTYIDGYRVVVRIPFTGDPGIFAQRLLRLHPDPATDASSGRYRRAATLILWPEPGVEACGPGSRALAVPSALAAWRKRSQGVVKWCSSLVGKGVSGASAAESAPSREM